MRKLWRPTTNPLQSTGSTCNLSSQCPVLSKMASNSKCCCQLSTSEQAMFTGLRFW